MTRAAVDLPRFSVQQRFDLHAAQELLAEVVSQRHYLCSAPGIAQAAMSQALASQTQQLQA
jgi:hypothetical protein